MSLVSSKSTLQKIIDSVTPFLLLLFGISLILLIVCLIVILILILDPENISFIILVMLEFSIMCIFILGFIVAGIRKLVALLLKREEIRCPECGFVVSSQAKYCSECGNKI